MTASFLLGMSHMLFAYLKFFFLLINGMSLVLVGNAILQNLSSGWKIGLGSNKIGFAWLFPKQLQAQWDIQVSAVDLKESDQGY
jgi:hypothetical protein